jgi:hypothetical protein
MKKSVNGKSFDEIFEQRGKEVQVSEMVENTTYLFVTNPEIFAQVSIGRFCKFQKEQERVDAIITGQVFTSGNFYENKESDKCGILMAHQKSIFEATTDQRELLNAYKNESK